MTQVQREDASFNADAQLKLQKTHDTLDRPEKFAELFCDVAKKQVVVQDLLRSMIQKTIQSEESKKHITGLIRQINKDEWKSFVRSAWGKVALVVWTVCTIALGAFFDKLFG